MNGDSLVVRVRQILKDVETSTSQGAFWDIRSIVLALNEAQNIFVDYCLRNDLSQYLNGLKSETEYGRNVMPSDYLHYMSAKVGISESDLKMARIYLGGEGAMYRYVEHNAAIILGDVLYFVNGTIIDGEGILYYYKRPAKIYSTELGAIKPFDPEALTYDERQDFDDYVYTDLIAQHAAAILGRKEVQTQRDFKKTKRLIEELVVQPAAFANYIKPLDVTAVRGVN